MTEKLFTHPHLVFYDGECGFCDSVVQFLLKSDKKGCFAFAPLQGETAASMLHSLPPAYKNSDSLVLIENYRTDSMVYIQAKAVFRICWLLGGTWAILGLFSFLPSFLFDWGYRLVARNRKYLGGTTECLLPPKDQKDRFLP